MNTVHMRTTERRALGWYAVHWSQTVDWLKSLNKRNPAVMDSLLESAAPDKADKVHSDKYNEKAVAALEAKKLEEAAKETHRILAHASSVFPFRLFPETVTVDRQKLTIVYTKFFGVHQTIGVPLENVKNIQADIGPVFGSLIITSDLFINNTQNVTFLRRKDARDIQRLVQGIIAANSEGIDLSKIKTKDLKNMLCNLGAGHTGTQH